MKQKERDEFLDKLKDMGAKQEEIINLIRGICLDDKGHTNKQRVIQ